MSIKNCDVFQGTMREDGTFSTWPHGYDDPDERDLLLDHVRDPRAARIEVKAWILGRLQTVVAYRDSVVDGSVWIPVSAFDPRVVARKEHDDGQA